MTYRFATQDLDYSDYSGGRVIYSQPGFPAFPVRLASEVFQRAWAMLQPRRPLTIYDPTCGGAYHLAALGFLHGEKIGTLLASDVDEAALELARRNLNLLTQAGLQKRETAIREMLGQFGKPSHAEALDSAVVLRGRLNVILAHHSIRIHTFQANVMDAPVLKKSLSGESIDLVFSDVPYGHLTGWQVPGETGEGEPGAIWRALEGLRAVVSAHTLVAIAADKSQKITHEAYQRVERFQVGKRQITFLRRKTGAE